MLTRQAPPTNSAMSPILGKINVYGPAPNDFPTCTRGPGGTEIYLRFSRLLVLFVLVLYPRATWLNLEERLELNGIFVA